MSLVKEFKVTDNMCGFNRVIKPYGMLDILQSVAGEDANNLGIGYLDLKAKGLAFVLARIKYDLYKPIYAYQEILVETTPLVPGRVDFDRDFEIYDKESKELIGIATSKWIIIDLKTRKICRSNVLTYPCSQREKGNYPDFDKLSFDDSDLKEDYLYLVRHTDIDFLGHMNNTRYADSLKIDKCVKHFEINYLHEVKLDDILFIKHNENKFIGYNGYNVSFKAMCEFFEGE